VQGLSEQDFRSLAQYSPVNHYRREAIFDYNTSKVIIFKMHESLKPPPFPENEGIHNNPNEMRQFIAKNESNRKIVITSYMLTAHHWVKLSSKQQKHSGFFQVSYIMASGKKNSINFNG
jgi:hypothetical protein